MTESEVATMNPAWYMRFSEGGDASRDRIGGLPTHLPKVLPIYEPTGEQLAFIAQIYCTPDRLALPNTLCVQLYQEVADEPLPVAIRLPIDAEENRDRLGLVHPKIQRLRIDWELKNDPDKVPDSFEFTDQERQLMESKVGGTPYYTDDELPGGHVYLFQLCEYPAGFNFADRTAIVTMDPEGLLHVRLQ
jgi:hypothetical protein